MKRFFYKSLVSVILFIAAVAGCPAEEISWGFLPENVQKVLSLDPKTLVKIDTTKNWTFIPGKTRDGLVEKVKTFRLKRSMIDLAKLATEEERKAGEGILCYEFNSKQDGIAQLGMGCDWWFEVRCNGILCYTTMNSGNLYQRINPLNHPFFLPVKKGKNQLVVRTKAGSRSWIFACGPVPAGTMPQMPILQRQPSLMWPDTDSISIRFLTCGKAGAGIEYREKNSKTWNLVWDHRHGQIIRRDFHTVNLSGLKPGAEYVYRAVIIDKFNPMFWNRSEEFTFRLPEANTKEFSFFFTADLQYNKETQQTLLKKLLKAANAETCGFIVLGGDIGMSFDPDNVVVNLLPLLPSQKPIVYMRGNHELRGSETERFFDYFAMPNGLSYGLFRIGDTAFMMLDSWEDKPSATPGHPYCKYNVDRIFHKEELDFIKPLFKSAKWTSAGKRIVLCHSAPYAHAGKMIPDFLKKLADEDLGGKNPKSRVNLWVSGHKHFHMRSIPGTNEIAAVGKPLPPQYGGVNYTYPVITVAGPSKRSGIKASAYRVDGNEKGIRVRGWTDDGTLQEDIFFNNDGKLVVTKEMKHYNVQPSSKK